MSEWHMRRSSFPLFPAGGHRLSSCRWRRRPFFSLAHHLPCDRSILFNFSWRHCLDLVALLGQRLEQREGHRVDWLQIYGSHVGPLLRDMLDGLHEDCMHVLHHLKEWGRYRKTQLIKHVVNILRLDDKALRIAPTNIFHKVCCYRFLKLTKPHKVSTCPIHWIKSPLLCVTSCCVKLLSPALILMQVPLFLNM